MTRMTGRVHLGSASAVRGPVARVRPATESAKTHGIRKNRPEIYGKLTGRGRPATLRCMAMRSIQQPGGRRPVLDDLDKSIIKALQLDGRRPYAQIGRQLKVPEATVRQRAGVSHVVEYFRRVFNRDYALDGLGP